MITTQEEFVPEYFQNNYSVTMHKEVIILEDNVIKGRARIDSRAFLPGDIDQLITYIGDENAPIVGFCNATWTPEIIAAQQAINLQNQGENNAA